MIRTFRMLCLTAIAVAALPALALAIPLGTARLVSVTPVDGGCVAGPAGGSVQSWSVEPGKTYTLTISGVTDCGNGGTDPQIGARVNNSEAGNTNLTATLVVPGTYQFTITVPATAACTLPILYCTTNQGGSGMFVRRSDGGNFQAHLSASTFQAGCTQPQTILGEACGATPGRPFSWGRVKQIYR